MVINLLLWSAKFRWILFMGASTIREALVDLRLLSLRVIQNVYIRVWLGTRSRNILLHTHRLLSSWCTTEQLWCKWRSRHFEFAKTKRPKVSANALESKLNIVLSRLLRNSLTRDSKFYFKRGARPNLLSDGKDAINFAIRCYELGSSGNYRIADILKDPCFLEILAGRDCFYFFWPLKN